MVEQRAKRAIVETTFRRRRRRPRSARRRLDDLERELLGLDVVADLAQDAGQRHVEGLAQRGEQLGGRLLLATLDLRDVAEADPGRRRQLAQRHPLTHPLGTQHVTERCAEQQRSLTHVVLLLPAYAIPTLPNPWFFPRACPEMARVTLVASEPDSSSASSSPCSIDVADQLHPVVQLQLAQRVLHVVLHRPVGEEQALGDLLVGHPLGDQAQHLGLALGEPGVSFFVAAGASESRRYSPSTSPASPGVKTVSPWATRRTASSSSAREADFTR